MPTVIQSDAGRVVLNDVIDIDWAARQDAVRSLQSSDVITMNCAIDNPALVTAILLMDHTLEDIDDAGKRTLAAHIASLVAYTAHQHGTAHREDREGQDKVLYRMSFQWGYDTKSRTISIKLVDPVL